MTDHAQVKRLVDRLLEEIAPDGLTTDEVDVYGLILKLAMCVHEAHAQRHHEEEEMPRWEKEDSVTYVLHPENPKTPEEQRDGEKKIAEMVEAAQPPMTPPQWDPESTVVTSGMRFETRAEWEAYKKREGLVEVSPRELLRRGGNNRPPRKPIDVTALLQEARRIAPTLAKDPATGAIIPPQVAPSLLQGKPKPQPLPDADGEVEVRGSLRTVDGTHLRDGEKVVTEEDLGAAVRRRIIGNAV